MNAELRRMAEEAGLILQCDFGAVHAAPIEIIEAFAKLVAEDCARVCGDYSKEIANQDLSPEQKESRLYLQGECGRAAGSGDCRNIIRTRYSLDSREGRG